jgi:hypothetical protein
MKALRAAANTIATTTKRKWRPTRSCRTLSIR